MAETVLNKDESIQARQAKQAQAAAPAGGPLDLSTEGYRAAGVKIDNQFYPYRWDVATNKMLRYGKLFKDDTPDEECATLQEEAFMDCVDLPDEVRANMPPVLRGKVVLDWLIKMMNPAAVAPPLAEASPK